MHYQVVYCSDLAICLNLQPNFCRRVKPLFFLSVLLLIGAFALFWNNEESSKLRISCTLSYYGCLDTFNFYLYKPTRSQVASFFTSSESNRSNQPKLKATTELIRGLTPKPVLNLTRYNKYMLTNVGGGACGGVGECSQRNNYRLVPRKRDLQDCFSIWNWQTR